MAADTPVFYRLAYTSIMNGDINLEDDSYRAVLVTSSYTPDVTHDAWSDISANEASGTGYTANGNSATLTVSESSGTITVDMDDQSWATSTITAKYLVVMRDADDNGTIASTDLPIFYIDLNTSGSLSSVGATFSVTINAAGILSVTVP